MKKFLGVLVAITLCACMLVPMASAATEQDLLTDILAGVNLGDLSEADLSTSISDLGLEGIDVQAILGGDKDALAELESAVSGATEETTAAQASGSTTGSADDILGGLVGDLSAGDMDSLLGSVGDAFSGAGVDLESAAPGSDVAGQIDSNNMMAGLMDTLFGTLESFGLDTSMIEGMLDNEIVNFFANMYIGYVGQVEEETTAAPVETTTKAPVVVTTKTPDTGDTSAVFAALATITVASAAAFVCLKKKEN